MAPGVLTTEVAVLAIAPLESGVELKYSSGYSTNPNTQAALKGSRLFLQNGIFLECEMNPSALLAGSRAYQFPQTVVLITAKCLSQKFAVSLITWH